MNETSQGSDITQLLHAIRAGDEHAESVLIAKVYPDLRRMARRLMDRERPRHTLQATALVHEVYMRIAGRDSSDWENRAQFFAVAARLMRQILVDHARKWSAEKRGGGVQFVEWDENLAIGQNTVDEVLEMDRLLHKLSGYDARQEQIVQMKVFAGLSDAEIAVVLGTSTRTIKRDWSMAKAWLHGQLAHNNSPRDHR
jgi:RNA polymerase sigma-70 factor (ECF subfamily)